MMIRTIASTLRANARLICEILAAGILITLVLYTWFAFPTWQPIYCLRTALEYGPKEVAYIHIFWDAAFFTAYFWIPVRLVLTWFGLEVRPGGLLLVLYGAFIVLCGLVHLGLVLTFWLPYYWLLGKLKALGGAVSLVVAYVTEKKHPQLLGLGRQGAALRAATAEAKQLQAAEKARADSLAATQKELEERALSEQAARQQAEGLAHDLERALAAKDALVADLKRESARAEEARQRAEEIAAQLTQALTEKGALVAELNIARDQATQRAQRAEGKIDDAERHAAELRHLNEQLERALADRAAASERIELQAAAIHELETPCVPLCSGVLLLPMVGPMDSTRAQRLMENLLNAVVIHSARVVILDLTGVRVVDSAVAGHLSMTAKAVRLVGSECIITGISGDIAMTVVKLGLELGIETLRDVQQGLALAMQRVKAVAR